VDALAQRGAVSVSRLIETDGDIEFADKRYSVPIIAGNREAPVTAIAAWQPPDAVALFAWMHKESLIKRLDAEIAAEADDKAALSHEERQRREAEVRADILAVERDEASLTWQAQAESLPVKHRADINPLALLGLRLVTPPHAVPSSPGSSPWHAISLTGPT
jgi:hypothetical protein